MFIRPDEIIWFEAEGNYIQLHSRKDSVRIRAQLSKVEERLDPEKFLRINRSAIVNLNFIQEMKPWFRGNYRTVLRNGTELILSRNYRERLFAQISEPLGIRTLTVAR